MSASIHEAALRSLLIEVAGALEHVVNDQDYWINSSLPNRDEILIPLGAIREASVALGRLRGLKLLAPCGSEA